MNEPQKSIISTSENLDITFHNGEGLSIAKTKHCVTLSLQLDEHNKSTYSADETPTPTRFIRNCEEVGLFQDLQNVNPFDETFKKAVELTKTGNLHIPEASTDDTLHTPHILPHEENPNNESQCIFSISRVSSLDEDLLKLGPTRENFGGEILDKLYGNSRDGRESLDSTFGINKVSSINEDLLIIANDDSDSEKDVTIKEDTKKHKETTLHSDTKKALRNKLQETAENRSKNDKRTLKLLDASQGIIITPVDLEKLRCAESATLLINEKVDPYFTRKPRKRTANQPSSDKTVKSKNSKIEEVSPDKEKVRAINRAAQSRSRNRKKKWINEMVKKIDDLTKENKDLLQINQKLRNEINLVRSVLQFHNDCSAAKDPETKQKIAQLITLAKQKQHSLNRKNVTRTKGEIPIRPAPILSATPVKIGVPVVHTIPDSVQVCVVPALNTRPLLQMNTVALEDSTVRSIIQIPK